MSRMKRATLKLMQEGSQSSGLDMLHCRLAAAVKREKTEQRHMGNFKRIYPAASAGAQAKYERLLQGSSRLFASSMKAKAYNTIGRIQVRYPVCGVHHVQTLMCMHNLFALMRQPTAHMARVCIVADYMHEGACSHCHLKLTTHPMSVYLP